MRKQSPNHQKLFKSVFKRIPNRSENDAKSHRNNAQMFWKRSEGDPQTMRNSSKVFWKDLKRLANISKNMAKVTETMHKCFENNQKAIPKRSETIQTISNDPKQSETNQNQPNRPLGPPRGLCPLDETPPGLQNTSNNHQALNKSPNKTFNACEQNTKQNKICRTPNIFRHEHSMPNKTITQQTAQNLEHQTVTERWTVFLLLGGREM